MKFTDGRWLLRPGVRAFHPVEVLDAETGPGTLIVRASVRQIRHRGDLLKGPMITLTLSAPAPDVIAVSITHLTGQVRRPPAFAVEEDTSPAARSFREGEWAVLTSGELSARVRTGADWRLEFLAGGRLLTASEPGAAAIVTTAAGAHGQIEVGEELVVLAPRVALALEGHVAPVLAPVPDRGEQLARLERAVGPQVKDDGLSRRLKAKAVVLGQAAFGPAPVLGEREERAVRLQALDRLLQSVVQLEL